MTPPDNSALGAPPRRKRGGQPGNANHLKHGNYSAFFQPFEKKALDQIPITDLQGEIETLRAFLHRYWNAVSQTEPADPEAARRHLLTVSFAVRELAALMRIQTRGLRFAADRRALENWAKSLPSGNEDEKDGVS